VGHKVKVILNPCGGILPGKTKVARLEQALRQVGLAYHLEVTSQRGHGIELARQAALEGWPIIAAAGGDGTVSEVVNGLMQAADKGEAGALGIIPLGTGNDLAEMLCLPGNIAAACQRLVAGHTRLIDVGQVNGHYFVNNSAVGLEPMVTLAHERLRWIKGKPRYILAALQTILAAKSWLMRLSWNSSEYDGPITLVSVGNSRRTGGSFYMTPHAVLDDGLLDFIYVGSLSRWEMLRLLPQTFQGAHIRHPQVVYLKTTRLSITSSPPTPIQADGEIIAEHATEITYQIIPNKLRVIV
jgi:YegS/Rv2252/BmrU family lipid kinase